MKLSNKHKYSLALLLVILSFFVKPLGDSIINYRDKISTRNFIESYLNSLSAAQKSINPSLIRKFVTDKEYQRISRDIATNFNENKTLWSKLEGLSLSFLGKGPGRLRAVTSEKWSYRYYYISNWKPATPLTKVDYDVFYSLVNIKGHWLIDHIWVERIND